MIKTNRATIKDRDRGIIPNRYNFMSDSVFKQTYEAVDSLYSGRRNDGFI